MKAKKKLNSGFTLLEIIIVIIIVGVLASLALPKLFSTVEFSKSAEALSNFQTIRGSVERCRMQTSDLTLCGTFNDLDVENPALSSNFHFTYTIDVPSAAGAFSIISTRNTFDGGDGTSTIWILDSGTDVTKGGTGSYKGIKG